MERVNKKGQWQNYLLPAIMAVLILGISFYFIFNAYFTGENIEREVCKESIMVRSSLPEAKFAGGTALSLKTEFPLKCKTRVIEVTVDDIVADKDGKRKVDNIIGDALVECWYIFGNGDANVFPSRAYEKTTTCIPCARIHLTNEAKEEVRNTMDGVIDIYGLLLGEMFDERFKYLEYLRGSGKLFDPFNPAFNGEFNLSGEKFELGEWNSWGLSAKGDLDLSKWNGKFKEVSLPRYLNASEGDLIIVLGEVTTSEKDKISAYVPYMFYFQNGQDDYTDEMEKRFFDAKWAPDKRDWICNSWEGIPA